MSTSTDFWRGFTLAAAAIFFSHLLRFKDSQPALGLQTHGFIQKNSTNKNFLTPPENRSEYDSEAAAHTPDRSGTLKGVFILGKVGP